MNILISIIIATYNSEDFIERALNSVLNQTISSWECIVVDGASKDSTVNVLEMYAEKDNRFRYISEPDRGIYNALNKGLKMAKGKWIYVLGGDDELLPDGLSLLLKHDNDQYDCIYGDVLLRDNLGHLSKFCSKPATVLRTAMCCSHQAIIMKRELMLALNGFDEQFKISADYELLIRAFLNGSQFKQIVGNICYFASSGGASSNLNLYAVKEQYKIYKKNKTVSIPFIPVFVNFAKRLMRQYIYDPKKKI